MIDYTIEYDNGVAGLYDTAAEGVANTNYIQTGLSAGTEYTFRVKARNAVDFSEWSDTYRITAATVPDPPAQPTTTLTGGDVNVLIDWSPDANDGGVGLQGYRLYIKTQNGDFEQDPTNCDAETDAIIIQNSACTIPVTALRQSPFALTTGDDVVAKVIAFNAIGDSAESAEGQGATVPAEGSVPGAPTSLQRIEPTDTTQATISWSAPSDDGGSAVTSYAVFYD